MYFEQTRGLGAAAASYNLTGTQGWTYPACNSGYTKKSSGKAHPNAYTCFSTTPPAPTCAWQNFTRPQIDAGIKQFEMQGVFAASDDHSRMMAKGTSLQSAIEPLSGFKSCSFYSEMVSRVIAAYNKSYDSRPPIMRAK